MPSAPCRRFRSRARSRRGPDEPITRRLEDHAVYPAHDLNADAAKSFSGDAEELERFVDDLYRMMDGFADEAHAYASALRS